MEDSQNEKDVEQSTVSTYWWVRQAVVILIAGFYLVFGIQLLVSAYQLNDPASFIYTFYASNFIILISAALLVGFVYRLVMVYRRMRQNQSQSPA
jgi:Na+/serine symporter